MGYYNQGLKIDPSLVAITGGVGKGMAAFGDSLVNLGEEKIKKAEKDAADKEKLAKIAAQAAYNKAVNPKMATMIGDENLGLIQLQAPVDNSKVISAGSKLVDGNGKEIYTAPKEKKYKAVNNQIVDLETMQPVYNSQNNKAPTQRTVNIDNKNVVQEYVDGKWVTSADAPVYNESAKVNETKGYKTTGGLSGAQIMFARDNNLTTKIDGKEYVSDENYKKLLEMDKIGNQEVR